MLSNIANSSHTDVLWCFRGGKQPVLNLALFMQSMRHGLARALNLGSVIDRTMLAEQGFSSLVSLLSSPASLVSTQHTHHELTHSPYGPSMTFAHYQGGSHVEVFSVQVNNRVLLQAHSALDRLLSILTGLICSATAC